MSTSDNINELAAALAKAQGAMSNAALNRVNPHFRSKYADLASVFDAARKPLAENGLAVTQTIDGAVLTTRLLHTSGQWVASTYALPAVARPQEMGSALTYARRYSLSAIIGLAADEDDDANAAEGAKQRTPPKPAPNVLLQESALIAKGDRFFREPANPAKTAGDVSLERDVAEQPEPAATPATPAGGGLTILDMAREAAKRGNAFFYGSFWDGRSKGERKEILAIKDELNQLMLGAD